MVLGSFRPRYKTMSDELPVPNFSRTTMYPEEMLRYAQDNYCVEKDRNRNDGNTFITMTDSLLLIVVHIGTWRS